MFAIIIALKFCKVNKTNKAGELMDKISVNGKKFIDEHGRERIFNGINVCDKGAVGKTEREYSNCWNDFVYEGLNSWGFNIIRFGITWDAIEHKKGKYNDEYIDNLKKILDKCEENGFYCYIDMHQDLYSYFADKKSWGDGAPEWACLTEGHKFHFHHFTWAEGYFWGKATQKSFDNFWANTKVDSKGLQDSYCDMWQHVVEKLGNHPAVIGFDIMNEPFPGTPGGKVFRTLIKSLVKVTLTDKRINKRTLISCLTSKKKFPHIIDQYTGDIFRKISRPADAIIEKFDKEKYTPFINKAAEKIREINSDGIIFLENSYYSNLAIPCCAGEVTVNGIRDKSFAYAPHTYDILADSDLYKYAGTNRIKSFLEEPKRMQNRLNIPVMFGEWGGYGNDNEWFYHAQYILDTFDKNKWSNTYWAYFDNLLKSDFGNEILNRSYPRAVTGEIISYHSNSNSFVLNYNQDKIYSLPTEIYIHKSIKAVKTDGEYEIKPIEKSNGSLVLIKTGIGEHNITIEY